MTDYTTIRVTEAAKDEAEDSKRDDETWNDYFRRCTENSPETREFVAVEDVTGGVSGDMPDIEDIEPGRFGCKLDEMDDVRRSLSTVEERTGKIERLLEDLQR